MSMRLPNPQRFINAYVIKEALLSSAIEGIYTTLTHVFASSESRTKPDKDNQLVLNYSKALNIALELVEKQNLPRS